MEPLFIWKDVLDKPMNDLYTISKSLCCLYCESELKLEHEFNHGGNFFRKYNIHRFECQYCGYNFTLSTQDKHSETEIGYLNESIIKRIENLNSNELTIEELGTYLKNNYSAVKNLTSRKFEILVQDVFRNQGYNTLLTQATWDNGYDLLLYEKDGSKTLIEIKKYKNNIGVKLIRELIGVQIIENSRTVKLVTSSDFSLSAKRIVTEYNKRSFNDYKIDLINGNELLKIMEVFYDSKNLIDTTKIKKHH